MNSVNITGRLTADPEVKYSGDGKPIVNFSIAYNEGKDRDASFFNCVAFNKQAEFMSNYGQKGRMTGIEGRLQARKWQANDGTSRTTTEIICNRVEFLDKRDNAEGEAQG